MIVSGWVLSLAYGMVPLRKAIKHDTETSTWRGSESSRAAVLWPFELQACGGRVREQPALAVHDPPLRGGGTTAKGEGRPFGPDNARVLGHALDEGHLEFQRGVAGRLWAHRLHGKTHRGVQQRRGVAAMHRADRVVMLQTWHAMEHHMAGLRRAVERL